MYTQNMDIDSHYMQIALDLAKQGFGKVSPNPMVGAVIVHEGKIIGAGYHEKLGGPHAEVNAINSVPKELELLIRESTIYVTLEPCSHFGKTPPCADLLIKKMPKKVVVGSFDPNPKVSGSGTAKLRNARIEVVEGVLKNECDDLNKRFITFHTKHRPYIILKWAESSDGYMAPDSNKQVWLTGEESKKFVHGMRAVESAILVGTKTIEIDDPELTVRLVAGKNPARVVIDKDLTLPLSKKVFSQNADVFVFNQTESKNINNIQYIKINFDEEIIPQILNVLYTKDIQSLIVEGGPHTLTEFIKNGFWDEAVVLTSQTKLGEGKKSPSFQGELKEKLLLGKDTCKIYTKTSQF